MAKDKKGFILYADLIKVVSKLPDEIAGKLFKIVLRYVNDLEIDIDDLLLEIAFEPIKNQLKRDLVKFEEVKEERSKSGQLGNLKRYHKDLYNKVKENEITLKEAQVIVKDGKTSHSDTNLAVTDTVNDTATDTVNVSTNVDVEADDTLHDIEILKDHYLTKDRIIKSLIDNKQLGFKNKKHIETRLSEFTQNLSDKGRFSETWIEYTKYFLNWHRASKKAISSEDVNKRTNNIPIG